MVHCSRNKPVLTVPGSLPENEFHHQSWEGQVSQPTFAETAQSHGGSCLSNGRLFSRTVRLATAFVLNLCVLTAAAGLPDSAPVRQLVSLSPEATEFLRGMILVLIPETTIDEDDWGQTKRVQSGLNVRFDGLQVRTSRRWKEAKHGEWKRVVVTLLDPAEQFELQVEIVPREDASISLYRVHAKARIRVQGRQQRWNKGVKLYSISGDAIADVALSADIKLERKVITSGGSGRLRILPSIQAASVRLVGFRLLQVGNARGGLVREFGRSLKLIVQRMVARKSNKLTAKINAKIRKKPERFEIPLGIFALLPGLTEPEEE